MIVAQKHIKGQYKRALRKAKRAQVNRRHCLDERYSILGSYHTAADYRAATKWSNASYRWFQRMCAISSYLEDDNT